MEKRTALWSFTILLTLHLQLGTVFSDDAVDNFLSTDENGQKIPDYKINDLVSQLQYSKYLQEVLQVLNVDDKAETKHRLHEMTVSGKVHGHLDQVDALVRSKLDEIKRSELHRIRQLSEELKRRGHPEKVIRTSIKSLTKHLDLKNLAQFGTEDLRRLVLEANAELAILDGRRREDFKEYEMHKALEFEELLKRLSPEELAVVERSKNTLMGEYKRKRPTNMPVSKAHLLKVWEERDQLNRENFNLKTFFHLHDLDGNGFWDEYELRMLLEQEIADYFDTSAPDFDRREKDEELERMREYAFTNIDVNKDHLIDLTEFIKNSEKTGFDDTVFWENSRRVPIFTPAEYAAYAELNRAEVNRLIDEGQITLPPSGVVQHHGREEQEARTV